MKSITLFCVIIAANGIYGNTVQLDQNQKLKVTQYTAECIKESDVKPEVLEEAKKGQFPDDENLKKFSFCFFKKAGIISDDGKLNMDTALAKLPSGVDKVAAQKVLEECKTKTGKDAVDTAFEIYKCYRQKTPTPVSLEK